MKKRCRKRVTERVTQGYRLHLSKNGCNRFRVDIPTWLQVTSFFLTPR